MTVSNGNEFDYEQYLEEYLGDDNGRGMDEFLKFERIENPLSTRPDLHAFMMLDKMFPGKKDIIGGAEHDVIFIDIDPRDLAKKATKDQLIDLSRCGFSYTSEYGLYSFA